MKRFIARLTFIWFIGISIALPLCLVKTSAQNPTKRALVKMPWPLEPVSVVAVKTKRKANIEIGKGFEDFDDWLDGLTVTIANNYSKTVTALTVEMVFRREAGDTRAPLSTELHFGPYARSPEYANRDPNKIIKPGKTTDLILSPAKYQALKVHLEKTGYAPNDVRRVELIIREVGFEDGSMIHTGTFFLQDPAHPNDPTKKIPISEPSGPLSLKLRSPPSRKT